MDRFGSALVVDRSGVARLLLSRYVRSYCKRVVAVASVGEARREIERCEEPALVALDATVPGALAWLEEWSAQPRRPAFAVVTSRPDLEEESRVMLLGAIAYLAKPLAFNLLARALMASEGPFSACTARARALPLAMASIEDPASGEPQVACEVLSLSRDGAFLAAAAPIASGRMLRVRLRIEDRELALNARVARVQEPTWGVTAGWGVTFECEDEQARTALERFVERHIDRTRFHES